MVGDAFASSIRCFERVYLAMNSEQLAARVIDGAHCVIRRQRRG